MKNSSLQNFLIIKNLKLMIFYSTIITWFMSDLKRLKKNYLQFFYIKKIYEKKI